MWQRGMSKSTANSDKVSSSYLRSWDLKVSSTSWVETLKDMTRNGVQRCSCCHFLPSQDVFVQLDYIQCFFVSI